MNYSKRGIQVAVVRTVASACQLPWIFYILLTFFVLSKISYTFVVLNELRCNKDLGQVLHTPCPEFCLRHMPMQYTKTQSISA